ncbi:MAG TPA: hypothetical protein VGG51_04900, partial [Candidatus Cybelea sp.]
MNRLFGSPRERASIAALSIALLAGCAGGASTGFNSLSAVPAASTQASVIRFGADGPLLQTLDVPLRQFPRATGTLLTGIRKNLITGFIDQTNGSNLGVLYDRTTGVWTPIKYPGAAKTSVYGPAIMQSGY